MPWSGGRSDTVAQRLELPRGLAGWANATYAMSLGWTHALHLPCTGRFLSLVPGLSAML